MTSIVIAAHNEALVIGRCLELLLRHAADGEFDIIVVANGCTDRTAASAVRPGVRVIEIDEANKVAALNAGDRMATGFPRIYLDADMVVDTDGVRAIRDALVPPEPTLSATPLAAVPQRRIDSSESSLAVRAYYAISARIPAFHDGLFGRGMIGLSADGRGRFAQFPDMVADDLFLDSLFSSDEKCQVAEVTSVIATPRRTRDLVRRLERVRRGNTEMREAANGGLVTAVVRDSDRYAWWRDVVRPHPSLGPAAIIYVGITLVAAARASRRPPAHDSWGSERSKRGGRTDNRRHTDV